MELNWKRENKTVAVIMPATTPAEKKKREKTKADYEAFKAAAGSLNGLINAEQLKRDIAESRKVNSRAPLKLY